MAKSKYSKDVVAAIAKKCKTKNEFRKEHGSAVNWAVRNGVYDEICSHMSHRETKWTEDKLHKEALKYEYRREFQDGSKGAYLKARSIGLLDKICAHMKTKKVTWTKQKAMNEALKYNTKNAFWIGCKSAYDYLVRNGLEDEGTSHMITVRKNYTNEALFKIAKKYKYRSEFERCNYNAYNVAQTRGILKEICSHMEYKSSVTDNDCIYIWKLVGEKWNDIQLYKIGITSHRLGDNRVKVIANGMSVDFEIIIMKKVTNAIEYERELLNIGENPKLSGFEGATEIRALTDTELTRCLDII